MSEVADPTARRRLSDADRTRLLRESAADVFLRDGYAAARMDEVARGAGMSKRTLYQHYPSKAALFEAVMEDCLAPCVMDMAMEHHPDLSTALRGMLAPVISHLVEPRQVEVIRVVVAEVKRSPELADAFYRAVHLHYPLRQRERGLLLDLHWAVDHPFVRHRIGYDELFASSFLTDVGSFRWRVPASSHELLLQVAHLEKECGTPGPSSEARWARAAEAGQLLGLLDLALMVSRSAAGTLAEMESTAERWGLAPTASAWINAARHPAAWRETVRPAATVSGWEASGGFRRTRLAEAWHYLIPPPDRGWWARTKHRLCAGLHLGAAGAVAAGCLLTARLRGGHRKSK